MPFDDKKHALGRMARGMWNIGYLWLCAEGSHVFLAVRLRVEWCKVEGRVACLLEMSTFLVDSA